jgi:fructose-1,6-bisphosphatase/sedoheptulose 1,7-bisphosphatase-like protein
MFCFVSLHPGTKVDAETDVNAVLGWVVENVNVAFGKEGADVAVVYLEEHRDAQETRRLVEEHGRKCLLIDGDVGDEPPKSDK